MLAVLYDQKAVPEPDAAQLAWWAGSGLLVPVIFPPPTPAANFLADIGLPEYGEMRSS